MIAVIDYGRGNLHSVAKALEAVGADVAVTSDAADLRAADRFVLPGVGAFSDCMERLTATGLIEPLREEVVTRGKPFLGICLGMELLARQGFEGGRHAGLGWIDGDVVRFDVDPALPIPHMGWNDVRSLPDSQLFRGIGEKVFYFAHSYCLRCDGPDTIAATADYGTTFTAAVQIRNIAGVQFHPEKSQRAGLDLLANFMTWEP